MALRTRWWDGTRQDLRFALRQLRRSPAFATVATLTLAFAVGANAAVFTLVEGVLLKPLPYGEPDRLAAVWARFLPPSGYDIPKATLAAEEVLDYRQETRALASIGIVRNGPPQALTEDGLEALQIDVWLASASMLPTLRVRPVLGRWFTEEEDVPEGAAVAVLTHDLWSSRYGSDPAIVDRSILMSGVPTRIVGVLPAGFSLGLGVDVGAYLPLRLTRSTRGGRVYGAIGRLAPGATFADVDNELVVLNRRWAREDQPDELWAIPLKQDRLAEAPEVVYVLLTAVGLVLLVACANVAGLLLARSERRRWELVVRTALGAGRGRIVRQLVTESLAVSVAAATLALPLAWIGTEVLIAIDPTALPRLEDVRLEATTVAVTLGLALFTTLLSGVGPAMLAGWGASAARGRSRRVSGGPRRGSLRRALVAAEVAVSLVVLILAGLLVRSLRARIATDPGFRTEDVLAFDLTLPPASYEPGRVSHEYGRLVDALGALPGMASVSGASAVPFGRHMLRYGFWIEGASPPRPGERAWSAVTTFVMPEYFETLGIPLLTGRVPTRADGPAEPLVGVINETMARAFWPGESPLGKRWHYGPQEDESAWISVVGVVPDQLRYRAGEEPQPQVYLPIAQAGRLGRVERDLTITARTLMEPGLLVPAVRSVVSAFDPRLPVSNVRTMAEAVTTSLSRPRLTTNLLAVFAALALALAVVGVYGVVSYSVAGRTREIGVRVALGADRAGVLGLVMAEAARTVVSGVALGLGGAWLATRLVEAMLYQVAPTDVLTFTALPLGLLAVAALASLAPALRATGIAPTEALRAE